MGLFNIGDVVTVRTLDMYGNRNPPKAGTIAEYAEIENKMQYLVEYKNGDEEWFDERKLLGAVTKRVEV